MIFKKVHALFFLTAIAIFVFRLLFLSPDDVLDINIHDTYFVVDHIISSIIILLSLLLIGLIYYLHYKFKVHLLKSLTLIHTFVTISAILIFHVGLIFLSPKDYLFNDKFSLYNFLNLTIVLGIILQPIFILNSIFGVFKYIIKK